MNLNAIRESALVRYSDKAHMAEITESFDDILAEYSGSGFSDRSLNFEIR